MKNKFNRLKTDGEIYYNEYCTCLLVYLSFVLGLIGGIVLYSLFL